MKIIMAVVIRSIVLTLILVSTLQFCFAQDPAQTMHKEHPRGQERKEPWWVERFRLTAGFFVPVNNTNVQVSAKGGRAATDIDFENDLGFNKTQVTFLANFQWRISRRSRLNLNYYNIPRSSDYTLKKDITFKDNTYHVDESVHAFFNTAIYQVSYGYAILSKPKYEAGLLIGAHLVHVNTGISLNGTVGGAVSDDFGVTAPLPDLGVWGGYAFSDRLAANLDFTYLSLTIGDINGRILSYNALLVYKLIKELDLSLGYSGLNFKITDTKPNITGKFKWGYNGPSLGATYTFGGKNWSH